jgi:hypothetical protein
MSFSRGGLSEEGIRTCLSKTSRRKEGALTEQTIASLGSTSTRSITANKQLCTNRINQGSVQAGGV